MNSGNKTRLTELLVARGLAADVGAAERAVLAGEVVLIEEGRPEPLPLTQARMLLDSSCELRLKERRRYVSRGGDKLAGALADFQFDPRGLCCLDVGASTGGFTDCLLQQGAASVLAVDVAYGQLAWPLRVDARVTVLERTNIRSLDAGILGRTFDLAVADVSFTPIRSLLASLASLLVPGGTLIALIKPPFELPEKDVGAKGIVSDPRAHAKALALVLQAAREEGFELEGLTFSPLKGAKGNIEFFIEARRAASAERRAAIPATIDIEGVIARAHARLD